MDCPNCATADKKFRIHFRHGNPTPLRPELLLQFIVVVLGCLALAFAHEKEKEEGAGFTRQLSTVDSGNKIETIYDQLKDVTTVRLNPMQVYGESHASINYKGADEARFYAWFSYRGQVLRARPKRVIISLISTSEDWKYTDYRRVTALVDGKPMKLGGLVRLPSFTIGNRAHSESEDYTRQEISISLSLKTFLRIAGGKDVRIRMGPREFTLNGNHLGAMRELAARMVR